jgi:hypothetical protein
MDGSERKHNPALNGHDSLALRHDDIRIDRQHREECDTS